MHRKSVEQEQPQDRLGLAAAAAAGGVLGQLAAGTGAAGTVAGGLVPVGVLVVDRLVGIVRQRREARAGRMLAVAAETLGGLDILEERTTADDQRVELLARVLEAAVRTPLEAKLRALGRVLADGVGPDGKVGEATVLATALADIEAPHIEVLRLLSEQPLPPAEKLRPGIDQGIGWEVSQLSGELPELAGVLDGLVAVLGGNGLLSDVGRVTFPGHVGPAIWRITDIGHTCMSLLGDGDDVVDA